MNAWKILIGLLFILGVSRAKAQNFTINMSSGKLILQGIDKVDIEGHNGSEVIIIANDRKEVKDKRAEGLREISAGGYIGNTGIGLFVKKDGEKAYVNQVSGADASRYTFKIPGDVAVYYEHSTHVGEKVNIKNLKGEIEVSANYNDVYIENAKGPMAVNTVYGEVVATFESIAAENTIVLHSVYHNIDLTIPKQTKAHFDLSTSYGRIYTDLDLEFDGTEDGLKQISGKKISGILNGGGANFSIKATYKNIYLRAK